MDIDLELLITQILTAAPFGLGAIIFFYLGIKRIQHFLLFDYQGNKNQQFKDNLTANIFFGAGGACIISAFAAVSSGSIRLTLAFLPLSICSGIFVIPIGIAGSYWQSYSSEKLFGGMTPYVRKQYGYANPVPMKPKSTPAAKLKLPQRVIIKAGLFSLLLFFGLNIFLYLVGYSSDPVPAFLLRGFLTALFSFGVFITILIKATSDRLKKLNNGERLDEDFN